MLSVARAEERFDPQQYLGWKIAICYHPMYLLIDEDRGLPIVGERVPPWGAATADDYVQRVRRNIGALEKDPRVKLNYEWSGYELDQMAERFPDVVERMKAAHKKGQLDFIGGEFSQPHAATLGSESCWRQFEFGRAVFERLFGKKIVVYATQETQVHPQLPQILSQFGYKHLVMPNFSAAVRFTEGPLELISDGCAVRVKQGDEFFHATALDGTSLPGYFPSSPFLNPTLERMRDTLRQPPILVHFPDMEEFHNPQPLAEPVLLGDALEERIKVAPPRAKGMVHTFWSYAEGVWAEELLRANRAAEESAILAGNVAAMGKLAGLKSDNQAELDRVWRTILKGQHHDIAWNEVTDLRRKTINADRRMEEDSRRIVADVAERLATKDDGSVVVVNPTPRIRKVVLETSANQIPAGGSKFQQIAGYPRSGSRLLGVREVVAGGVTAFAKDANGWASSREAPMPAAISADDYRVEFSPEGLMRQIILPDGTKLLAEGKYLGGEMRAVVGDRWVDNRAARPKFAEGDVCFVVERDIRLDTIPAHERYLFFRHLPAIKVEIEFDFNGNELGDFHIDQTKLNIYYPTAKSDIYHDVPFGFIAAQENEQLLVTNWLYSGGLVYVNRGTPKHWVRDGVLANTVAWGGRAFSNRMHKDWLRHRQYDLRLFGKQKIEYFLIPAGAFDAVKVVRAVDDLIAPVWMGPGNGTKSFYSFKDESLTLTSLYEKDGEVWARGYKLPSRGATTLRDFQILNAPLRALE